MPKIKVKACTRKGKSVKAHTRTVKGKQVSGAGKELAHKKGTFEYHAQMMQKHGRLSEQYRKSGDSAKFQKHYKLMDKHLEKSRELDPLRN